VVSDTTTKSDLVSVQWQAKDSQRVLQQREAVVEEHGRQVLAGVEMRGANEHLRTILRVELM
jgi:hypothetical protein